MIRFPQGKEWTYNVSRDIYLWGCGLFCSGTADLQLWLRETYKAGSQGEKIAKGELQLFENLGHNWLVVLNGRLPWSWIPPKKNLDSIRIERCFLFGFGRFAENYSAPMPSTLTTYITMSLYFVHVNWKGFYMGDDICLTFVNQRKTLCPFQSSRFRPQNTAADTSDRLRLTKLLSCHRSPHDYPTIPRLGNEKA